MPQIYRNNLSSKFIMKRIARIYHVKREVNNLRSEFAYQSVAVSILTGPVL